MGRLRWVWLAVLPPLLVLWACVQQPPSEEQAPATLPAVVFTRADGSTTPLSVEVADTPELATCGLMHRLEMPANQAMLFVFEIDYTGSFWNRNTFIPLTLAWIAANGQIVGFSEMANVSPTDNPQRNTFYTTPAPARYVIEANQGWFAQNGVGVGDYADVSQPLAVGSNGAVPICREKGL